MPRRKVVKKVVPVPPQPLITVKPKVKAKPKSKGQKNQNSSSPLTVGGVKSDVVLEKTDARVASAGEQQLILSTQLRTVTIEKLVDPSTFYWVAVGFVTRALERGFLASASDQYVPYYAVTFMTNLMINYASVKTIPVTTMPYWLLCLCHAISPKPVRCGHGLVNYKLKVTGTVPASPTVNTTIGYQNYGYQWSAGWQGGAPINSFPVVSTSGSSYTADLGASAFQELCQFAVMQDNKRKNSPSRLVQSTISTPFMQDVSAFALFKLAEGIGAGGSGGGMYGQAQLEVPLLHPLLSLVTCSDDSFFVSAPTRNFTWAAPIAGDAVTLGSLMSSVLPTAQLSMKRNLRFKMIDFLEFVDVLAQWVTKTVQANLSDQGANLTAEYVAEALCPVTLQEMMILLRNTMMGAFKNSQSACQGIYPFRPQSDTDNEFVPYVCGTNCCYVAPIDMQLPRPLVENIRALVMRKIKYPASAQDVLYYLPVLGQYALDVLSSSDYQVTYTIGAGSPTTVNVFASGAIFEKVETDAKGNQVRTPMVETAISMVDGSSSTSLVFINDPNQLKTLCAQWNSWVKGSGLESFSSPTITLSTELGINVLCSIAMTRVWINGGEGSVKERERKKPTLERENSSSQLQKGVKIVDKRTFLTKNKGLFGTVYTSRQVVSDISQGDILDAPYNQVLQTWILPQIEDEFLLNTTNSLILQRYQFMMDETRLQPRTIETTGTTQSALHAAYAAKMTKGKLTQADDWSVFFDQMAKLGRGGILSGIVAGLVGEALPQFKDVAHGVASLLPI